MIEMADKDLFDIQSNDKVGRYAVAKRNLKAGDTIFLEKPFAYGPKSDTYCICLGCFEPIDCTVLCTKCSWPVCGPDCENRPCHRDYECEVFSKANVKFQPVDDPTDVCLQYECITPLRVLYKKLSEYCWLKKKIQNDGKMRVQSMEAHNDKKERKSNLGIQPTQCRRIFERAIVAVRAAIDVPKGGELYSSYTYSLWPTLVRREFFREGKYFDCSCARCCDKTELGTNNSTLKCNKCDNGIILPADPLDDKCYWNCTHCEFRTNAVAVRKAFAAIQADIDAVEYVNGPKGIEERETIYKRYKSVLHPKNAYMSILRSSLIQLYGKSDGYEIDDLPDILLERKVELCMQLLEVLDVIEPGRSRIRGIVLYELHGPLMALARHQYQTDTISKEEFKIQLQKAIDTMGKAVKILKQEPENLPEGQLGKSAESAYKQLIENFDLLVENA
ncbi:hypothetical protein NQ317_016043 [Molorchus minor]|uniref:SET domain-containing protein n=1 Tax=Molorchus minor TaxID=1323400 RepID=A0ABQ9JPJ9_9CUCU|nr:hypothetical protein NQ317_016043 [Molorchus minor]